MRKAIIVLGMAALLSLPVLASAADRGDRMENRLDRQGDRIENRLDRRGDRVDNRLDRRGQRIDRRYDRRHN